MSNPLIKLNIIKSVNYLNQERYYFLIPVSIFAILHIARPIYFGFYHDDWSLFVLPKYMDSSNLYLFTAELFRDRPMLGLFFRALVSAWNGLPWELTVISSIIVGITAVALFIFLLRLSNLGKPISPLFPATATAAWIAIPWGLGYSLWPTGALTLIAMPLFLVSAILYISFIEYGGNSKLIFGSITLGLCFFTYQAWYLAYAPLVFVVTALISINVEKIRRCIFVLAFSTIMLVASLVHAAQFTPKHIDVNFNLINKNILFFVSGWPTLIAAICLTLWSLAIARSTRVEGLKLLLLLTSIIGGVIIATLPFSLTGYELTGIGMFSRTTVVCNFWLAILLMFTFRVFQNYFVFRTLAIFISFLLIVLIISSANLMQDWEKSWDRQKEIIRNFPYDLITNIPRNSVIILDEDRFINGLEVFAAPWDITGAVFSQTTVRKFYPITNWSEPNHPIITPYYEGWPMIWDGEGSLDLTPSWKMRAEQLWIYSPKLGKCSQIVNKGPIPRLSDINSSNIKSCQ